MIAEYDEAGDLAWNYVYGMGQRVARYNGSNKQAYHNDHLGNMRAITDTTGTAVARADYYPFGEKLNITGASRFRRDSLTTATSLTTSTVLTYIITERDIWTRPQADL